MKIQILRNILIDGEHVEKGSIVDVDEDIAVSLMSSNRASMFIEKKQRKTQTGG